MALKIRASSLFIAHYLKIKKWGVEYMETAAIGGRRKFYFSQIDYVFMSPENVLSFQVGQEVFKIQTKPAKAKHQRVIKELLQKLNESNQPAQPSPR